MAAGPSLPPGPSAPGPLQTLRWLARPAAMLEDCARRYGDTFTIRIAHEGTWVFLTDPEAVKQVFTGDPRLLHAGEANVVLLPLLGPQSVLLLDEGAHMAERKLMLPSFHGERMRRYEDVMREVAARTIEAWPAEERLSTWPFMQSVTLEVIMRTVFGVQDDERLDMLGGALRATLAWGSEPSRMALMAVMGPHRISRLRDFRRAVEPADALLYDEIARGRADPHLEERDDVLSLLLQARHENGRPMSDEELRDELMTLLVAGHETTATALAWAIEALARHPHVLARLRDEIDRGDDAYLDAVVKETLRLRPVVAPLLHRRPDLYPDPRAFRPERFLERPAGTYTWIPFGGGVRRCLGASFAQFEMRVVLRELVARLDLAPGSLRPERRVRRAIFFSPSRGGEVVVRRREPAVMRR